jgi:hypothetical protein
LDGERGDADDVSLPPEQWFDAQEGLRTIKALLQDSESLNRTDKHLLSDLRACEQVLERARHENVRFHFSVDF